MSEPYQQEPKPEQQSELLMKRKKKQKLKTSQQYVAELEVLKERLKHQEAEPDQQDPEPFTLFHADGTPDFEKASVFFEALNFAILRRRFI